MQKELIEKLKPYDNERKLKQIKQTEDNKIVSKPKNNNINKSTKKEHIPIFERVNQVKYKKQEELEKMKNLLTHYNQLKCNNIRNIKDNYSNEEWNIIQDALYLNKLGYLK